MSEKNFMSYGDAETVLSEYANAIKTRAGTLVPSVSYYQSGTVTKSVSANAWDTFEVTFTTPMPDADYVVTFDCGSSAYVHVQDAYSKNVSGFRGIVYNRDATTVTINWQAFKLMTDESRALDEQAIADIQAVIPSTASPSNKVLVNSDLTSSVTSGSTAPVTSGGVYSTLFTQSMAKRVVTESDITIDGSTHYANDVARVQGRNTIIFVKNPTTGRQWPVTNSNTNDVFFSVGANIQFYVDRANYKVYMRSANVTDMGDWFALN